MGLNFAYFFSFFVLGCTGVLAATETISGPVPAINTVAITEISGALVDFGTLANTNIAAADIILDNNSTTGFTLTISGAGKFVRSATPGTNLGDFITYTIALTGSTGTLGCSEPILPSGDDLSAGDSITNFNTGISQATASKIYKLNITTTAKSALLAGNFSDTLTASIIDI